MMVFVDVVYQGLMSLVTRYLAISLSRPISYFPALMEWTAHGWFNLVGPSHKCTAESSVFYFTMCDMTLYGTIIPLQCFFNNQWECNNLKKSNFQFLPNQYTINKLKLRDSSKWTLRTYKITFSWRALSPLGPLFFQIRSS